jgi:hypothetical protein
VAGLADVVACDATLEGVPSALAAARDGIDALLRDPRYRRTTPDLITESLLRGAVASAQLEGSGATVDDVRAGRADAVATGAAQLNGQLLGLVPVVGRAPLQALAKMHVLADPYGFPESRGRPREMPGIVPRLHALAGLLTAAAQPPAIAVAAVAHAELATLQPFGSVNGLVARALERLLLVARGVDPTSLTVPECGHLVDESAYHKALLAYAEGGVDGRRRWLMYAASAIAAGAAASPLVPS